MKKFIKNALEILFNKATFFTVLLHWLVASMALYQRGGFYGSFHFYYEPLLFKIVGLLNLPSVYIAGELSKPLPLIIDENYPLKGIIILVITITIQWWMIGCAIKQIFFTSKEQRAY